jgi:hypothetical protein
MTIPRPSLVTSSGPSPVRGFIAAMLHPLSPAAAFACACCLINAGLSHSRAGVTPGDLWCQAAPRMAPSARAAVSHNRVDPTPYYPVSERRMVMNGYARRQIPRPILVPGALSRRRRHPTAPGRRGPTAARRRPGGAGRRPATARGALRRRAARGLHCHRHRRRHRYCPKYHTFAVFVTLDAGGGLSGGGDGTYTATRRCPHARYDPFHAQERRAPVIHRGP